MFNFDKCKQCKDKLTTSGCVSCNIWSIKKPIQELDLFLESHKSNLSQFIFYINQDYYNDIKNVLNFDLNTINLEIRVTPMMETNQLVIIVDKKKLDWGNVGIERWYLDE